MSPNAARATLEEILHSMNPKAVFAAYLRSVLQFAATGNREQLADYARMFEHCGFNGEKYRRMAVATKALAEAV